MNIPTWHIFDCTQGMIGRDGEIGGATRLRQAKYGLNKEQRKLNMTICVIQCKRNTHSLPDDAVVSWLRSMALPAVEEAAGSSCAT